ncbi:MAG: hypothetical protein AAFZ01_02215 [Pseudomonadota bacterium]
MGDRVWQWFEGLLPVPWSALDGAEKINALAAFSQTLAALLSVIALGLSLWVFFRQQRLSRWQLRLHREDHVIAWVQNCIAILAEVEERASGHGHTDGALLQQDDYISLRSRLSFLIDEGRLYFPNHKSLTHGRHKHSAFQGHRQKILDPLVSFYEAMAALQAGDTGGEARDNVPGLASLNDLRRTFVSEAQRAIDPRKFNRIRA